MNKREFIFRAHNIEGGVYNSLEGVRQNFSQPEIDEMILDAKINLLYETIEQLLPEAEGGENDERN